MAHQSEQRPASGLLLVGFLVPLIFSLAGSHWVSAAASSNERALTEASGTPPSSLPDPSATPSPTSPTPEGPTASDTPTLGPSASPSPTPTVSASPDPTASPATPTPSPDPTAVPSGAVLINEVAWAGTRASAFDEWIELHNPGPHAIRLDGWRLTDNDDIDIALRGTIPPYGFFLLERTDDSTVASLPADQIYAGSLHNEGETLVLLDPSDNQIDTANKGGGDWPAGDRDSWASMERLGGSDVPGNWVTFSGTGAHLDAEGNTIAGTPGGPNSPFLATPTTSLTPTPRFTATPVPTGRVLINEVAWAGSLASPSDEWIELHNPYAAPIDLEGWRLTDGADIDVALSGAIEPGGYFLLERTDDAVVSDIAADLIYRGTLRNSGERLELLAPDGSRADSANRDGGSWPAGRADSRASMERRGGDDRKGNWGSFTGYGGSGVDAHGDPIQGTPKGSNSVLIPTPTPTWIPGRVVINEVLIRPHYDWEGTGGVTPADEFIELYNHGPGHVYVKGWWLDDVEDAGSKPYDLPGVTLSPGGYAVFFRSQSRVALNDGGDTVRLLGPDGRVIDKISYLRVRAYNLSYGRLPDGSNALSYGLWPTPGEPNLLFEEPAPVESNVFPAGYACQEGQMLRSRLPRQSRHPALRRWFWDLGLAVCR